MKHLNLKFADGDVEVKEGVISGYASLFGIVDQGNDKVLAGAYSKSLNRAVSERRKIKMLWQHDPSQPIGVWDEVKEDEQGLFVRGRILKGVSKGSDAAALIEAGAIDGSSIGYQTRKATKGKDGVRELRELDLWEVSLVTFPMQIEAGVTDIKEMESGNYAGLKRLVEKTVREAGFHDEAKAAAAACAQRVKGMRDAPDLTAVMADLAADIRGIRI